LTAGPSTPRDPRIPPPAVESVATVTTEPPPRGEDSPPIPGPQVLSGYLGGIPGDVLEVACGNGAHGAFFAPSLPETTWWPTDVTDERFSSVRAYAAETGNMREPHLLDVADQASWDAAPVAEGEAAAVVAINLLHISPWACTLGLVRGAAKLLRAGAPLIIYGPFKRGGVFSTESNREFDENLKGRNPEWGYRDVEAVEERAAEQGLALEKVHEMPANNLMLVFRKAV